MGDSNRFFDGTHEYGNNTHYLSSSDASRISGFTSDYLSRLCRQDVLRGKKQGHTWYVEESALNAFVEHQKKAREYAREELSRKRKLEYLKRIQKASSASVQTPNVVERSRKRLGVRHEVPQRRVLRSDVSGEKLFAEKPIVRKPRPIPEEDTDLLTRHDFVDFVHSVGDKKDGIVNSFTSVKKLLSPLLKNTQAWSRDWTRNTASSVSRYISTLEHATLSQDFKVDENEAQYNKRLPLPFVAFIVFVFIFIGSLDSHAFMRRAEGAVGASAKEVISQLQGTSKHIYTLVGIAKNTLVSVDPYMTVADIRNSALASNANSFFSHPEMALAQVLDAGSAIFNRIGILSDALRNVQAFFKERFGFSVRVAQPIQRSSDTSDLNTGSTPASIAQVLPPLRPQNGTLVVNAPTNVNDSLSVQGNGFYGGSLSSGGEINAQGSISTEGSLTVGDTITVNEITSSGPLTINTEASITGSTTIGGVLNATGGVETSGADVDLGSGRLFASNVIGALRAGTHISITGPASNPIISSTGGAVVGGGGVAGVKKLNELRGELTLSAGDGIAISDDGDETITISSNATTEAGGSDGQIQFNSTTNFGGASQFYYDSSSDAVGIGTSSPYALLSVHGLRTRASSTAPLFVVATSTEATTTTVFLIDSNGRLGVGTTTATTTDVLLAVGGSIVADNNIKASNFDATSTDATSTFSGALTVNGFISSASSTVTDNFTVGTSTLFVDTINQKIAIGPTSTPMERLTLVGGSFLQKTATNTARIVGQLGLAGSFVDVYVSGNYAYLVEIGATFMIVDVSRPTEPQLISTLEIPGGTNIFEVFVSGEFAYIVGQSIGLQIIDVSNPVRPVIVGSNTLGAFPEDIFVSGNYAYTVERGGDKLRVIDISDPTSPTVVGNVFSGGFSIALYVSGNYAYTVDLVENNLKVFDISDPTAPIRVGELTIGDQPEELVVSGRYAYVIDAGSDDLKVIDISDPSAPTQVGSVGVGASSIYVSGAGNYIYVLDSSGEIRIVDVTNTTSPEVIGSVLAPGTAEAVAMQGRYLYVVDQGTDNLTIIDISGIEVQSAHVHSLEAGSLSVQGGTFLGSGLHVNGSANFGRGGFLSQGRSAVSSYSTGTPSLEQPTFSVSATDQNNSSIVDVLRMTHMGSSSSAIVGDGIGAALTFATENTAGTSTLTTRVASVFDHLGGATSSSLRFELENLTGLQEIFRINSSSTVGIGTTSPYATLSVVGDVVARNFDATSTDATSTFSGALTVNGFISSASSTVTDEFTSGGLSYLSGGFISSASSTVTEDFTVGSSTLYVDTTNQRVAIGPTSTPMEQLTLLGGSFFQAGGDSEVPYGPKVVGSFGLTVNITGTAQQGHYYYVVDNASDDLKIIDVSDPTTPVQVGSVGVGPNPWQMKISGRYVYIGDRDTDEILVVDVSVPSSPRVVGRTGTLNGGNTFQFFSLSGNYIYVVHQYIRKIMVIDVSDPTNPFKVQHGPNVFPASTRPWHITIDASGRYAYATDIGLDNLYIFDISNPDAPVLLSQTTDSGVPGGTTVSGRYAYLINSGTDDITIFDISDPVTPTQVSIISNVDPGDYPIVVGRYLYITEQGTANIFRVIDISNKSAPEEVGSLGMSTPGAVHVHGRYAYVHDSGTDTLEIIDLSGIEVQSALVHSLESGNVYVRDDVLVDDHLTVVGGATIGSKGLYSQGRTFISVHATDTPPVSLPALSVSAIDDNNAQVVDVLRLSHFGSSTNPAYDGIGAALTFANENTAGTSTLTARVASVFDNIGGATSSSLRFELENLTGLQEIFRINSSSTVGIGTTSPYATLSVVGNVVARNFDATSTDATSTFSGALTVNGFISSASSTVDANFTVGSSTLFVDAINQKVAIGPTSTPMEQLTLLGGSFFQAGGDSEVPYTPKRIATLSIGGRNTAITHAGNYLYIIDQVSDIQTYEGSEALYIVDITDPSAPTLKTTYTLRGNPRSVVVSGKYAYLSYNTPSADIEIIDISNPLAPLPVGSITSAGLNGIWVHGSYLYMTNTTSDDLQIMDISNPSSPEIIGVLGGLGTSPGGIFVSGRFAYVSDIGSDDLKVIDISNPATPLLMDSISLGGNPGGIDVSGRYAYVGEQSTDTFRIFDISDPSDISQVGSVSVRDNPIDVTISGRYAYVLTSGAVGLYVFDVKNPAAPEVVGIFGYGNRPEQMVVSGRYVYVIDSNDDELLVIDISGIELQSALVHSLEAGTFAVSESASIGRELYVTGSASIGSGGFFSQGRSAVSSYSTGTPSTLLPTLSVSATDDNNASIVDVLRLSHFGSSTNPAYDGIGAALTFANENTAGTSTLTARVASVFDNIGGATSSSLRFELENLTGLQEIFRINSSSTVGIGTTSPYATLSVVGPVVAEYFHATATNATSSIDGGLAIETSGLIYDYSSGHVGIGTDAPNSMLHVDEDSAAIALEVRGGASGFGVAKFTRDVGGNGYVEIKFSSGDPMVLFDPEDGGQPWSLGIDDSEADSFKISRSNTMGTNDVMTFDTALNVGVASTTPWGNFSVELDGSDPAFVVADSASNTPAFLVRGLLDGSGETSGFVGIATSSPYEMFSVGGNGVFDGVLLVASTTGTTTIAGNLRTGGLSTHASGFIADASSTVASDFTVGGGTVAFINLTAGATGNTLCINGTTDVVTASGGNDCTVSSEIYKKDIDDIEIDTSLIYGLRPVSFTWRDNVQNAGERSFGLIAEEVDSVLSDLVVYSATGSPTSVNYSLLSVLLLEELQQRSKVFDLSNATSATSTILSLYNGTSSPAVVIDKDGNVGIGTSTPSYELHVAGDIGAYSFVNISSSSTKKSIVNLGSEEYNNILDKIASTSVATYRYQFESDDAPTRLGLIAEEAPEEVLSVDRGGVDVYKLASFSLAGVKALGEKINLLDARITKLEEKVEALQENEGQEIVFNEPGIIKFFNDLKNLGEATLEEGKVVFNEIFTSTIIVENVYANTITAQSLIVKNDNATQTGITLYDRMTGLPQCLYFENGNMEYTSGECGTSTTTTAVIENNSNLSEDNSGDIIPPTLTILGANPAILQLGAAYSDNGVLVADNKDSNLGYSVSVISDAEGEVSQEGWSFGEINLDTGTSSTYTITYTATDSAGNKGIAQRKVIIEDNLITEISTEDNLESISSEILSPTSTTETQINTADIIATSTATST
jgi:hypothetical protein